MIRGDPPSGHATLTRVGKNVRYNISTTGDLNKFNCQRYRQMLSSHSQNKIAAIWISSAAANCFSIARLFKHCVAFYTTTYLVEIACDI